MEPLQRLNEIWSWLPAFRAVADTEHLPSASKRLCLSPPALSRAIHLLEEAVGRKLFRKSGRRLVLEEDGRLLVEGVREGMRRIHDGLVQLEGSAFEGELRVSSAGLMTPCYVLPALKELRREHPGLRPTLTIDPPEDLVHRLLTGRLDVAFLSVPIRDARLETKALGERTSGIYCAPGHPLFERAEVTAADLEAQVFVTPSRIHEGWQQEGWPVDLPRQVGLQVDLMSLGVTLCKTGEYLAVLPDPVAALEGGGRLRRLPFDLPGPIPLYAVRRPPLGGRNRVDLVLERVRALMAADVA
ncbi:MAG: LysR family transcriptional regulator [Planctomycetota bacterium]